MLINLQSNAVLNSKEINNRKSSLDLFRVLAITSVVIFHTSQMFLGEHVVLLYFTNLGKYGVDLFFVLSGFLVGGLYWSEKIKIGSVNILKFIVKRSLRTIPPYYVILVISFIGVYFTKNAIFDIGYLFFTQNYYSKMPYFLVSWSLCIEEHFYLLFPFIILLIGRLSKNWIKISIVLISVIPIICRIILVENKPMPFDYYSTATHLHYDALFFGVSAAYIYEFKKAIYQRILKIKRIIIIGVILILLMRIVPFYVYNYTFGLTLFRLSLAMMILAFFDFHIQHEKLRHFFRIGSDMTYSIYLVHAFVINILKIINDKYHLSNSFSFFITFPIIILTGFLFYQTIDKSSLRIRKWVLLKYFTPPIVKVV